MYHISLKSCILGGLSFFQIQTFLLTKFLIEGNLSANSALDLVQQVIKIADESDATSFLLYDYHLENFIIDVFFMYSIFIFSINELPWLFYFAEYS